MGISSDGGIIEYRGGSVAEKELGLSKGSICKAIKMGYKCKGYRWKYKIERQPQ